MDKQPASSNLQGLENEKPIPRGEPGETISVDPPQVTLEREHQPTGKVVREQSDIYRLQDEDFRARVQEIASGQHHSTEDAVVHPAPKNVDEYDPVVHPDSKLGRLHLLIRYNEEHNQLLVQITDAQGVIRPEQLYAPEMNVSFSLVGNGHAEHSGEQHARVMVENAAVAWKEPIMFSAPYETLPEQTLHVIATNHTDPSAPRDREVFIPLKDLKRDGAEIKQWFDLQFVKSS